MLSERKKTIRSCIEYTPEILKEIEGVGWRNETLMAPDRPLEISLEINKTSSKNVRSVMLFHDKQNVNKKC